MPDPIILGLMAATTRHFPVGKETWYNRLISIFINLYSFIYDIYEDTLPFTAKKYQLV